MDIEKQGKKTPLKGFVDIIVTLNSGLVLAKVKLTTMMHSS